jgi:N-acetyl-anhydromuramyl-L-alanine amidase AmpD
MNNWKPSPNYSPGWKRPPIGIIIHWTAGKFNPSLNWMCNPDAKASAHWIVDIDGKRTQMVATQDRAWHAGKSSTHHGDGCNEYTFGIELVGPPSKVGQNTWNMLQLDSAAEVCRMLKQRFPIIFITDHSTVSPGRKVDVKCGTGIDVFPWEQFVKMTQIPEL